MVLRRGVGGVRSPTYLHPTPSVPTLIAALIKSHSAPWQQDSGENIIINSSLVTTMENFFHRQRLALCEK